VRADGHISIARADVRSGELTRHVARRYESGRVYAVSTGLGLPRTWHISTSAAFSGLEKAMSADGADGSPTERLKAMINQARTALADQCDCLVERMLPDATLAVLMLEDGQLHVMSVGPGRVYIQRAGRPKRLTSRDDVKGGLLRARPSVCSTPLEPGDLVLAGSVTAFSMSSIAKAMSVLTADPETAPAILASLLTEPAAKAGVGAAAVVLRVR
jgi:hypothetical protein